MTFCTLAQTKKNIVDVTLGSKDHTTLVAALKVADLVTTLQGERPFTVFATTDTAFAKLKACTLNNLLLPKNKATLAKILTYHVVSGNLNAKKVLSTIKKGGANASLTTVSGGILTARVVQVKVVLTDELGCKSSITTTDLKASNGVIYVVDRVLMPM